MTALVLLLVLVASVAALVGWLAAAHHHRVGPYADTQIAARNPHARRHGQVGGYWR